MKKLKLFGLEDLENNAEDVASTMPADNFESEALIPEAELGHDADDLDAHAEGIAESGTEAAEAAAAVETGFDVTQNLTELAATMESILTNRSANVTGASIQFVKGVNFQLARLGLSAARAVPAFESLENETAELEKVIVATADAEVSTDVDGRGTETEQEPVKVDDAAADISNTDVKDITESGIVLGKADDINEQDPVEPAAVSADAAAIAVEGLGDTIDKAVSKIVDNMRKARKAVSDAFARVFTGLDALRRRAYTQKAALKGLKGDAKNANLTFTGLHRLALDGKVDPKSILKGLDNSEKVVEFLFGEYAKNAEAFFKDFTEIRTKHSQFFDKEGDGKFIDAMAKNQADFTARTKKALGSNSEQFHISGDRVLTCVTGYFPELEKAKGAASVHSKQETTTPSIREIGSVVDSVIHLVDLLRRDHQQAYTILAAQEKALADAQNALESAKSKTAEYDIRESMHWLTFGFFMPINETIAYTFTTLRSALKYAEKGAAQYSKAE